MLGERHRKCTSAPHPWDGDCTGSAQEWCRYSLQQLFPCILMPYRGGGGGDFAPSQMRSGKFFCGKFRGAPWVEWILPPPESTVCTAGVREIRGEPGISRGICRGQSETRNFPRELKVPRKSPPPCTPKLLWNTPLYNSITEVCILFSICSASRRSALSFGNSSKAMQHSFCASAGLIVVAAMKAASYGVVPSWSPSWYSHSSSSRSAAAVK